MSTSVNPPSEGGMSAPPPVEQSSALTILQPVDTFKDRLAHDPEVGTKISSGAERAGPSEKQKQQAMSKCYETWGESNVNYHFEHLLDAGGTTWSKIRRLAIKEANVQVAVKRIRDAVYWRLTHPRPGRSSELYPMGADFEKTKDAELPAIGQAAISAAGYAVNDKGWLMHAERRLSARVIDEDEDRPLGSAPSDLEDEYTDDIVDNRKSGLQLDTYSPLQVRVPALLFRVC